VRTMDPVETAWVAGIFEGEGCATYSRRQPQITINMSDLDIIQRVKRLVGAGNIVVDERGLKRSGRKTMYNWRISAQSEVLDFLAQILPQLGSRRTLKAEEIIEDISGVRLCAKHSKRAEL
jgi:hypothetical protein